MSDEDVTKLLTELLKAKDALRWHHRALRPGDRCSVCEMTKEA